jgi:hypothetical protein
LFPAWACALSTLACDEVVPVLTRRCRHHRLHRCSRTCCHWICSVYVRVRCAVRLACDKWCHGAHSSCRHSTFAALLARMMSLAIQCVCMRALCSWRTTSVAMVLTLVMPPSSYTSLLVRVLPLAIQSWHVRCTVQLACDHHRLRARAVTGYVSACARDMCCAAGVRRNGATNATIVIYYIRCCSRACGHWPFSACARDMSCAAGVRRSVAVVLTLVTYVAAIITYVAARALVSLAMFTCVSVMRMR